MSNYNNQDQKGLIITDDISLDPILDFKLYRDAIVNILRNSYPKFTIGIFGDWGTGKTTLMNAIDEYLEKSEKDIIRVRFETWRYEREEQFALVPLLKTIAFALPDDEKFRPLKEKLKKGAINFLKKTPDILSSLISKYINEDVGTISKKAFNSFTKEFNSKMELLAEIDRDTLYFDGFDIIREEINTIRKENPNFKIVVFIDDLDRCSPKKTLEVLESIKVFLGMEGFIYIIGLSHDIVTKLIDIEYEKKGVKGEQYIKKIIQIPITLPDWNKNDIKTLLDDFISKDILHKDYKTIIKENIDLIATAVEENPRETKRFLNNFIVAYEIYSKSGAQLKELLILQTLNMRWNEIYKFLISSNGLYLKKLELYIKNTTELKKLDPDSKDIDLEDMIIVKYRTDQDLWEFLKIHYQIINNIQNWNIYRRATKISQDPTTTNYNIKNYPKIFVSYSSRDADEFANHTKRYLSTFNYDVFTGVDRITLGENWNHDIEHNISNCDIFVVIVTYGALSSQNVEDEVLRAKNLKKLIIPCFYSKIKDSDIKWDLDKNQGIRFSDKSELAQILYRKLNQLLR